MQISPEIQKVYDLKRAEKLLDKHKILDKKQQETITAECVKAVKK